MALDITTKLKKNKVRRILVISAGGGIHGGIQCLYLQVSNTWELISHASIPYPAKILNLFNRISEDSPECLTITDVALLDYHLSQFCIESVKTLTAKLNSTLKKPHYIIFNKFQLWRGMTGDNLQQTFWDLSVGDPQLLASSEGIPVFTDFIHHDILSGGSGCLPLNPGNTLIASRATGKVALINIGKISHFTIINTDNSKVLIDSDVGPGTSIIDKEVRRITGTEKFDRDGSTAAQGKVDSCCLDALSSFEWFLKPCPKQAVTDQFNELLRNQNLLNLSQLDRVTTLTALSAKVIYEFYRREISPDEKLSAVYCSGGGTHNLTLMKFLSTYFDPVPVKSIEELGIPVDMRVPLAVGLTVDAYINKVAIPWETGNCPKIKSIGKWIIP